MRKKEFEKQLNEGLIMTYDIDKCKHYLMSRFPNIKAVRSNLLNPYVAPKKSYKSEDFASIELGCNYHNYEEIIQLVRNLFGWFVSHIDIRIRCKNGRDFIPRTFRFFDYNDCYVSDKDEYLKSYNGHKGFLEDASNIIKFSLVIEKKFPTPYENDTNEMFYHLTKNDVLHKILTQGLVPRSEGNFPCRIYLGKDVNSICDMVLDNINEGVLLKVNVDGLKLYQDPRDKTAIFTYDNIAPNRIEIIQKVPKIQESLIKRISQVILDEFERML